MRQSEIQSKIDSVTRLGYRSGNGESGMTDRPHTLNVPARMLSNAQIDAEEAYLGAKWDEIQDALIESGGMSGSPCEWIWERLGELEAEARRRAEAARVA